MSGRPQRWLSARHADTSDTDTSRAAAMHARQGVPNGQVFVPGT